MTRTFDPKCYDLAALFLSDHHDINSEQNRCDLAAHIQSQVEEWIEYREKTPAG